MTEAMPRKTRKEKLRATQKLADTGQDLVFTYSQKKEAKSATQVFDSHLTFVRNDIFKTVLLGTAFILFEIGLAFYSKKIGW